MKRVEINPGLYGFEPSCEEDKISNITVDYLRQRGISENIIEMMAKYNKIPYYIEEDEINIM